MRTYFITPFVVVLLWIAGFAFSKGINDTLSDYVKSKETRREFFYFLDKIALDSAAVQINALQGFLMKHPEFEPVYYKLLERYLYYNQISEAQTYFQKLLNDKVFYRNSSWMLAKLVYLENNPAAAFQLFKKALQSGVFSSRLFIDFIEFDHQQGGKLGGGAILSKLSLNPDERKIVTAFLSLQKSDYERTIEILQILPSDLSHDPVILHWWGQSYIRLLRYSEADSIWQIGLRISRTNSDKEAEAQFLSDVGYLNYFVDKYESALSYFDSAKVVADHIGDLYRKQWLLGHYAYISKEQGDYAAACKLFQQAITISTRLGAYRLTAEWYRGYADAFYFLGLYDAALREFEESERYAKKANNIELTVSVKLDVGNCYISLKQTNLAKRVFREAYDLAESKKIIYHRYIAGAKLGDVALLERKYDLARKYYKEFIDFLDKRKSFKLAYGYIARVAKTYMLEGRYDLAKKEYLYAYKTTKDAGIKAYEAWYLLRIADIEVSQGNFDLAFSKYDSAFNTATNKRITEMMWEILLGYGNAYRKSGNLNAAISAFQKAAEIIETNRKRLSADQLRIGYFVDGSQVYQELIQCYLLRYEKSGKRADLDSLYYFDAMARSRVLQEFKRRKFSSTYSDEYFKAQQQLRSLQRLIRDRAGKAIPSEEWIELQAQLEASRYSLISQRLRMFESDTSADESLRYQPSSLSAVLQMLREKEIGLLLYHISNEVSFVLAITGDQTKVVRLPVGASTLASAVDSLIAPFHAVYEGSVRHTAFRAGIAHQLYQWLVKPVEGAIKLPSRLVVVPDKEFSTLPFELLLVSEPERAYFLPTDFPSYSDQFLVHRHAFVYVPSVSMLLEEPKTIARKNEVLAYANPFGKQSQQTSTDERLRSLTGWRFEPLPFADKEVTRIQEVQSTAVVHHRQEATKASFMREAPEHQVVHIASHAFVDTVFDAFSGLVLATSNDSTDDGLLMGYEISDLKLACDLVVLSACETGRGQQVAGEGVLGLPRLFLGAGAQCVLMTLWKVDDKFTSEFMPLFYENFLGREASIDEALCLTKRSTLNAKASINGIYPQHPFYWAGFTLYGNPWKRQEPLSLMIKLVSSVTVILTLISAFLVYRSRQRRAFMQLKGIET